MLWKPTTSDSASKVHDKLLPGFVAAPCSDMHGGYKECGTDANAMMGCSESHEKPQKQTPADST